eukprot:6465106-Amphidinium_carterae.1
MMPATAQWVSHRFNLDFLFDSSCKCLRLDDFRSGATSDQLGCIGPRTCIWMPWGGPLVPVRGTSAATAAALGVTAHDFSNLTLLVRRAVAVVASHRVQHIHDSASSKPQHNREAVRVSLLEVCICGASMLLPLSLSAFNLMPAKVEA